MVTISIMNYASNSKINGIKQQIHWKNNVTQVRDKHISLPERRKCHKKLLGFQSAQGTAIVSNSTPQMLQHR